MRLRHLTLTLFTLAGLMAGCAAPAASSTAAQPTAPPASPSPASASAPAETPRRLTFMAGYKAQANLPFAAAYVAQEQGYFTQQGLAVDIKHSNGQDVHLKLLLQGAVDVTTATADSVLKRRAEQDVPLVAFALFGQRGDRAFAVLEDSDIRGPKDFEGKLVGYKVYPSPDYLAMLDVADVDRSKIHEVSVGFDPRVLSERKVDVYPVFVSNEPHLLRQLGFATRLFAPADYGVPTLGLTYITRRELLEQEPDVLARFLKAALKGTLFAQQNPQAATDIVMRYAPQESQSHQLAMLQTELEMAAGPVTERHGLGWMTAGQWQALHDSLRQFGGLAQSVDVQTAFTDQVLQQVYREGESAMALARLQDNSRTAT